MVNMTNEVNVRQLSYIHVLREEAYKGEKQKTINKSGELIRKKLLIITIQNEIYYTQYDPQSQINVSM